MTTPQQPGTRGTVEALRERYEQLFDRLIPRDREIIGGSGYADLIESLFDEIAALHAQGEVAAAAERDRLSGKTNAYDEINGDGKGEQAWQYAQAHAPAEWLGHNIWHFVLADAKFNRTRSDGLYEDVGRRNRELSELAVQLETAEADLSAARSRVQELEPYLRHKVGCPLATTYTAAHAYHFENHDGIDDWPGDTGSPTCGDTDCTAWAVVGREGRPDCTCGLDALCKAVPPAAQEGVRAAFEVGLGLAFREISAGRGFPSPQQVEETWHAYLSSRGR